MSITKLLRSAFVSGAVVIAPQAVQAQNNEPVCPPITGTRVSSDSSLISGPGVSLRTLVNYASDQICTLAHAGNGITISCNPLSALPVPLREALKKRDCPADSASAVPSR